MFRVDGGVRVAEMDANNVLNGKFTLKELSRGTVVSRLYSAEKVLQSALNAVPLTGDHWTQVS